MSRITSKIAQSTSWIYPATPLTKSLVTLKTFLPMTTGSMKLMSVVPEKNNTHLGQCSSELHERRQLKTKRKSSQSVMTHYCYNNKHLVLQLADNYTDNLNLLI